MMTGTLGVQTFKNLVTCYFYRHLDFDVIIFMTLYYLTTLLFLLGANLQAACYEFKTVIRN
jgi:uncharacterized BrkB/YihY/UPF0761 family membrane protein